MKVILEHPPEMEIRDAVVEVMPSTNGADDYVVFPVDCPHCTGRHHVIFKNTHRVRLHDDGSLRVYGFVGIES